MFNRLRSGSLVATLVLGCALLTAPKAWAVHTQCGDGVVDSGEGCDDGNRVNGDGCSATCKPEMLACGVSDPSAAACSSDEACGFGNRCDFQHCTSSLCGCRDQGPPVCTNDCQGSCVKAEVIVCVDESQPECQSREGTDALCMDQQGVARPSPNAAKCWSNGDCGPTGLCVRPECVASWCFCSPGEGWSCTEDCEGGDGRECRYPGDRLPSGHPICAELNQGKAGDEGCIYAAQAEPTNNAPTLGGLGGLLGLGLLGLRRRSR